MPDQSSASSEHAIMREITAPLAELPEDPVASVANQDFPLALRGYDRVAVDAYVRHVSQVVAELYASRSPEGAVRRALERVGEEVSEILKRAHHTAEQLAAQSRSEAEDRLIRAREEAEELTREARQRAEQIVSGAERRARELDAEVDHIWAERDRIVEDVRKLSEDLGALASTAATRFPAAPVDEEPASAMPADPPPAQPEPQLPPQSELALPPEPEFLEPPEPDGGEQPTLVDQPALTDQPTVVDEPQVRPAATAIPRLIDLLHLGRERVIGCWKVGDVLIDPGPTSCLETLLEALGDERPGALLLTHIHLDHAGASGALVERWPDLEVYVHERGASHLMDPSRLLKSARRLYGEDMERLWGEMRPVPEQNIRILRGGEQVLDCFEVAYTPGHASHHVSYLYDDRTAFVGDVGGVRITPDTLTVPPTPPPEVDLEAWHASLDVVARWRPDRLAVTHFGVSEDVENQLAELSERLDRWAALAHAEDLQTFVDAVTDEISRDAGPELLPGYTQAAPPEQLYAGLERYWRKREQGDAPAPASTHAGRSSRPD
jgi:glyoxylase-like metal-dependent hydrolase (beta-lactamase superfamily II)/cell division septum initiation protein DivIVA